MTDWHPYTHGAQRTVTPILVATGIALAFLLGSIVQLFQWSPPWWVDTPAVMGCYGIVVWLFDRFLWRARWIQRMHGISDLSGEYEASALSSHDGHATPHQGTVTIAQSWTHLVVRLETPTSSSVSCGAWLVEAPGQGFHLHYSYHNTPKAPADPALAPHEGTAEISFDTHGRGKGSYYTGRSRKTVGELVVVPVGRDAK